MCGVQKAVSAVRSLFNDGEIPEDFEYEGQTFDERCEAWVLHAVDELSVELEMFEDERLEDAADDKEDEEEDEGEEE